LANGESAEITLSTVHEDLTTGFGDLTRTVGAEFADLKGEIRTGFADLKGEMRAGFDDLKGEMRTGFAELKGEMRAGFDDLKGEMRTGFAELKGEMRSGFADLKVTLVSGFQALPTRESSEEMVRLLRENNRLQEERFTQLDVRIREQHLETQQVLRAVAESQRTLIVDLKALIARLDALIRGRGDGAPA
jgi:hypothetical protein